MDYEKKYKDALSYAKSLITEVDDKDRVYCADDIKNIFPELKENKDEKIRKALISMFKHYNIGKVGDVTCEEIIGWLEKQKAPKWSDKHPNELPCYKQVINNLSKAMEE